MSKAAKISLKVLKVLGWILLALIILVFLILLFIRSPWGQDVIVDKAVAYVKEKTGTEVSIDRLFITFAGNVSLEGVYLEDQQADTLLYSRSLETGVALLPLIKNGAIHVSKLDWEGLRANVSRDEQSGKFNFDFLIEAFQSDTTTVEAVETDSTSSLPDIDLGPIHLKDFNLSYVDGLMGVEGQFQLGELSMNMERMDLNRMDFYIKDLLFNNSSLYYKQTKPFEAAEEDTLSGGVMPVVIVDHFVIQQVKAYYESEPDGMLADINLGDFLLELPEGNLEENKIRLRTLKLHDSEVVFKMAAPELEQVAEVEPDSLSQSGFTWPDWTVEVREISLDNNHILYQAGEESPQVGYFNPNAVDIQNLSLLLRNLSLQENEARLALNRFSFQEKSGFALNEATFGLNVSGEKAELSDLKIATNRSQLGGNIALTYATLEDFLNQPENADFDLRAQLSADVRDAFVFSPELATDTLVRKLALQPVTAEIQLKGSMEVMDIRQAVVAWGSDTRLQARGSVANAMDPERLRLNLPLLTMQSSRRDLLAFVDENQMGIKLPEQFRLNGDLRGALDDLVAVLSLTMPEGELRLDGQYRNTDRLAFKGDLQVRQLQLDKLLQNPQLGTMTFDIHTQGKGQNLQDLDAVLTSDFQELVLNGVDYSGLELEGEMADGKGKLNLLFDGDNLDLVLEALADLDSVSPTYQVDVDLQGIDLFNLGFSKKEMRASLKLNATFEGDPETFDLKTTITDGVVVYDRRPFQLGPVDLVAHARPDTTSVNLDGDIINMRLRSNASIAELSSAIQRHISTYLSDSTVQDTISSQVEMKMMMSIESTPILQQVFLEGLQQMDSISMEVDFKEAERLLTASLDLPYVLYNNMEIDSLRLRLRGDQENLRAAFGLISLDAGPLSMGRTYLTGRTEEQRLHVNLISFDNEDVLFRIGSYVALAGDTIAVHIEPDELVLNRMNWSVPDDNRLLIGNNYLSFENFIWQSGNQELSVSNDVEGVEEEHLGISFENFRLSSITSLLNPDTLIADGLLNGKVIVENLFGATGIIADANIDSLKVTDVPLGNLSLNAESKGGREYLFNLALKEGDINLDLVGDYVAADSAAQLNLDLAINELKLKAIEGLSGEQIRDAEGFISGQVDVSGTTANPIYKGDFRFNEAVFTVSTLNSRFRLSDEVLNVDNSGLYLNNFTITDSDNNNFVIGGEVLTEDFANPSFNLKLNAENFRALNSSREDNDLFYGDLLMNANINITGDLNLPIVKGRLKINNDSELTFIIPESQLDIVERDGVVIFVDRENPDEILTKREAEQTTSDLTGIQLSAIVEVEPEAIFNIVVDESSGDNLQIGGKADLNVNMDPNGRITLSGKYEVSKGHYEMSLYNLVSRRFEIDEGSSITWGGDPMDATLNIRAIYRVETSASELMASQLSGAESELANQFRQQLPFLVYLNVDGDLLKPLISFGLDMPEDQQGAIGGNVYTRVQQVNTQEDELNKQVFSLLVLNRFFPATGSDGSGGGTAAMARSSVSQMLSGQLNAFSNSLFGNSGLELDFDLDSFEDYQDGTGQTRTQLNVSAQQRLFNDRLVVQVGSQVDVEGNSQAADRGNPVFGNVSVEYLLTENGRYRLRGFRKNQFESIIDGQLVVTGISLIFNREFNKFWELWKGIDPEQQEIKPDRERIPERRKEEDEEESEEQNDSATAKTEEDTILTIKND